MATYPVRIHVNSYGGTNPNLQGEYQNRIEAGKKIEAYLNQQMKDKAVRPTPTTRSQRPLS